MIDVWRRGRVASLAALDAAPEADVVLVANTGLDDMVTVGEVAARMQADHHALVADPARRDPAGREERIQSPFGWWERTTPGWPNQNVELPTGGFPAEGLTSCLNLDHVGRVVGGGHRVRRLRLDRR